MATITELVTLDKTSPTRTFGDTNDLELRSDGTAITSSLTRAVLTVTDADGVETVIDSDDAGWGTGEVFSWDSGTGVLSMRLGGQIPAAGSYEAELDVYDGTTWYRWTSEDDLFFTAE